MQGVNRLTSTMKASWGSRAFAISLKMLVRAVTKSPLWPAARI